ncbi:MAG: hypothetical protein HN337_04335 [Deltaproteobacteria bacterium]|jgi:hypothetical protein|nr:hypothetical protein [Deltaproteobacteria bacterium]
MKTFDNILLLGRPASGKSEFIDCLKKLSDDDRSKLFHIGKFEEIDDFPWFWEKFLEDNLWEEVGQERLFSHREGNNYGMNEDSGKLFDLMLVKFNQVIAEKYLSDDNFYNDGTLFIEFSRGGHGGYSNALPRLSKGILERAAILYVDVSFEESWRKNNARYEEKKKHSILAHKATDRVVNAFYKEDDWQKMTGGDDSGLIDVAGIEVPFVTVMNEPEIIDHNALAERYSPALIKLMQLINK